VFIVKDKIKMEKHISWHLCCFINFYIAEQKIKADIFCFMPVLSSLHLFQHKNVLFSSDLNICTNCWWITNVFPCIPFLKNHFS